MASPARPVTVNLAGYLLLGLSDGDDVDRLGVRALQHRYRDMGAIVALDRIGIVDHGRIIALGTAEELVRASFQSRSEVAMRFVAADERLATWTETHGGRLIDLTAQFTVDHPGDIGPLLDAAAQAGLEIADLSLRKPNLESVFLHLTGKELRD